MAAKHDTQDPGGPPDKLIINELLAYASYYIEISTIDKIFTVLSRFYVPAEIDKAKSILFDSVDSLAGKLMIRRDSTIRSANDANLGDILTGLKSCSSNMTNIRFVAGDMDRIPKYSPEEISIYNLIDRITHMESEMAKVKEEVNAMNCNNVKTNNDVFLNNDIDAEDVTADTAITERHNIPVNTEQYSYIVQSAAPASNRNQYKRRPQAPPGRSGQMQPGSSGQAATAKTLVKRSRPPPVTGKKKIQTIRGECRKVDVFLYRVHPDTDDAEIRKLFTDANIPVFNFEKVSNELAKMKSYKIKISLCDFESVCNADFLPENTMCRRFFAPRPREAQGDVDPSVTSRHSSHS